MSELIWFGLCRSQTLHFQDIDGATLALLVEYMYSGRLDIDESNVQCLLSTATILQLACVRDACSRCVSNRLQFVPLETLTVKSTGFIFCALFH